MNPNDNNVNGVFYDSNGNPIANITSGEYFKTDLSMNDLSNNNPVPIITSQEEFSCTVALSEEDSASLWAMCEGLEIIDGGNHNV